MSVKPSRTNIRLSLASTMVSPLTPWSGLIAIRSTWGELSAYEKTDY
jgi:hypothetical protein